MRTADRLKAIGPYLFADLDLRRQQALARGVDIIDLGVGDPDQPPPQHVVRRLCREAHEPGYHRYPPYEGLKPLRQALAGWYAERFHVDLDPDSEVLVLIGSKEGLSHLCWAFVDPGDVSLVPDPAYPVYGVQTRLCGGEPYPLPLRAERDFLPDLGAVPDAVCRSATLLFLNYPNNPTSAVADLAFFEEAVAFCRRHGLLLCHDAAYIEMTYDGYVAPSVLQVPGAREVAVEFYSLSKPFNMTGWRLAFAVGNRDALGALRRVKTNTDSGQFLAVQAAGEEALRVRPREFISRMNAIYQKRRDVMLEGLEALGWRLPTPRGTFYLWVPVPRKYNSVSFAGMLLERAGVLVSPGLAFGREGEGYVRLSLTVDEDRLVEALGRIRAHARYP
ncbi:MAG: LL-diaminopimelate aminotransferase [Acetobacteraceae bacterium]|nr:LL-diaminopimelate aminotransferase [Acetobacteraceae bacterium]